MKLDFTNNILQREPITAATAIGLGITAASAGGQIYAQGKMNRKTREWNEKMYGIQRADAIADRDYNNTENQMKRLKEAGLNPALLYGQQGAGGQTQTRGSSPGSWNPEVAPIGGMGMILGQQVAMQQAQIRNLNASSQKMEQEATKIGGADTQNTIAQTAGIYQGIENQKIRQQLDQLELEKNTATFNDSIEIVMRQRQLMVNDLEMQRRNNKMDAETYDNRKKQIAADLALTLVQKAQAEQGIEESKQNIELKKAEVSGVINRIAQEWQQLYYTGEMVSENKRNGQNHRWANDMQESFKISQEAAMKIMQAIGIGQLLSRDRTIIQGFGNKKTY